MPTRLYIGERLAYEWRYEAVRLWEIDAESAFESGETGPLALVPLLRGGDAPEMVQKAVRRLGALPRPQSADALSVLFDFASQRYDRATLISVLGKDRIMQSYLWQMGLDAGLAEGEAKGESRGEAKAAREICVDLTKAFHPRVAKRVVPVIEACDQPERLRAWILECPKLSDAAFVALIMGKPTTATRTRANRPSRRTVAARKGQ